MGSSCTQVVYYAQAFAFFGGIPCGISLDNSRVTHNMSLLLAFVGDHPLWPAIKANAYGHGSEIFAWHLIGLGYKTLCVAHLAEAVELVDKGIEAQFIILSPTLAENSAYLDAGRPGIYTYGLKPYSIC